MTARPRDTSIGGFERTRSGTGEQTMGYQNISFSSDTVFLVTGGAGFIGSNLCEAILKLGCRVRCFDDFSTGKQANVDLFAGNPAYEFIRGT